jgi:hypothetical protein
MSTANVRRNCEFIGGWDRHRRVISCGRQAQFHRFFLAQIDSKKTYFTASKTLIFRTFADSIYLLLTQKDFTHYERHN